MRKKSLETELLFFTFSQDKDSILSPTLSVKNFRFFFAEWEKKKIKMKTFHKSARGNTKAQVPVNYVEIKINIE